MRLVLAVYLKLALLLACAEKSLIASFFVLHPVRGVVLLPSSITSTTLLVALLVSLLIVTIYIRYIRARKHI